MLILFLLLLEIIMFIKIFNKDKIFGTLYILLILYCIMPHFARLYDNKYVNIISHVVVNDTGVMFEYNVYCFIFLFMLFILFELLLKNKINNGAKIKLTKLNFGKLGKILYFIIHSIVIIYLFGNFIRYFGQMSYFNQRIVKSNLLWSFLIEFSAVFAYIDILIIRNNKKKKKKSLLSIVGLILILLIAIITSIKIGNRGMLLPNFIGILFIICENSDIKIEKISFKKMIKVVGILFLLIMISQFIRGNRGGINITYHFSLNKVFDFFQLSNILFQDYTIPGNSLIYCMQNHFINPTFILQSFVGNSIFFLDYPTVAKYLSNNYIAVGTWFGIGGFLPTESYMMAGYIGTVLSPLIIVLFYKLYYALFFRNNDKQYKLFVGFLMEVFLTFNLVRGQIYFLPKTLYMYILPAIILYRMIFTSESEE